MTLPIKYDIIFIEREKNLLVFNQEYRFMFHRGNRQSWKLNPAINISGKTGERGTPLKKIKPKRRNEKMQKIATKSQTTVDVYEFLSANKEDAFTIKQIAEALGVTTNKITGSVVSMAKKGIATKDEREVEGKVYKTYQWAAPAEYFFEEVKAMSDKSVQVLQFLQENEGGDFTAADIGAEIDMVAIAVNGVVNSLVKKGLAFREEAEVEMPDGSQKVLKFIQLTPEGKEYKF